MVKAPPSVVSRARGALLGHASGNALGVPTERLGTAGAIKARFPDGVRDIRREDTPASPHDDDVAMALILGEWILDGAGEVRDLLDRWDRWASTDGRGIGSWTREALALYRREGRPPTRTEARGRAGNGAVMRALPIALATLGSPRNLLSATLHTAELTHPDPEASWPAVAVNVAAHCLLRGRRDFIPEVVEALRLQDDVPPVVVETVRRVPFLRRDELVIEGPGAGQAIRTMQLALWCAHHEPVLERGVTWLASAGGDTDTNAAVAGGLMGARDGEDAVPARWRSALAEPERVTRLAERLVGLS